MRLRCHPVRVVRYSLLLIGGLALITGVWQYFTGKSQSGKVVVLLLTLSFVTAAAAAAAAATAVFAGDLVPPWVLFIHPFWKRTAGD